MKRLLPFFLLFFSTALLQPTLTHAQISPSVGLDNIHEIRVDDITDEQLLRIYRQAQAQGLSVQEIASIARARGMPAAEVAKLTSRLNRLAAARDGEARDTIRPSTRAGDIATPLYEPHDREPGDEVLVRELERLVRERNEREVLNALDRIVNEGMPIFGEALFRGTARSFEPPINIPTPANYVFGTDDEVVINVWGAAEVDYRLTIDSEGNIRIPNIGPIRMAGLSVAEGKQRILTNLQRIYSGLNPSNPEEGNTFADVSLGNVRSISVNMIGEVRQPGSYTVSSLATVLNMLSAAGGPGRSGSWRSIQVIREGEVVSTFDLYDVIVHGNTEDNIRLQDQDIIKVSPYINRVRLLGEVKRPGIFEMKEGETLRDLIGFSGGFSEGAYTDRIVVQRTTETQRSISDVKWPEGGDLALKGGDEIKIGEVIDRFENRVTIEGAVYQVGDYELTEGMTLLDLIEKAEGIREDAYLERGMIYRTRDNLRIESIAFSVGDIVNGYVDDIPLRREDLVQISSLFDMQEAFTIAVSGAVNRAGEFDFLEDMTLEDAIFKASGLRDEAAAYRVEVARRVVDVDIREKVDRVAEIFQFEIDENFSFRDRAAEFRLQPFDMVFVRAKPNYQRQLTVRIEGEVQYPGEYVLERRDARITDLIEQAGGLSEYAYPQGASMERIIEIQGGNGGNNNGLSALEGANLTGLNLDDVNLRRQAVDDTITTAVGIRMEEALSRPRGPNDLILEEGDVIRIPKHFQTIRVEGGVLSPVSMRYVPGRGLQNYIDAAGGPTDRGQRSKAYIVYPNGEVDRTRRFLFMRSNPTVEPGATIIVPEKPLSAQRTPEQTIALTTAILSSTLLLVQVLDRIN